IVPLAGALDCLLSLRGVSFEYTCPEEIKELPGRRIGMVAQEVEKVMPDWVETGTDGYKRTVYRGFEALSVEAIRELRSENDGLRAKVNDLEKRLADIESVLGAEKSARKPR